MFYNQCGECKFDYFDSFLLWGKAPMNMTLGRLDPSILLFSGIKDGTRSSIQRDEGGQ